MKNFVLSGLPKYPGYVLVLMALVTVHPPPASGRSSFWISARDTNACIISAVVQYDSRLEARLRRDNGMPNAVLQMDIHTKEPQELCHLLSLHQDDLTWRPLLCVTGIRGDIYSGYLVLPQQFNLTRSIDIRLGERVVRAEFIK